MNHTPIVIQIRTRAPGYINYGFLVIDPATRTAAAVDPAWEFQPYVAELQRYEARLDAVLLTHSHNDHTNLVPDLQRRYDPIVCMSRAEIDYYGFRCRKLRALEPAERIPIGGFEAAALLTPGHTAGSMCYLVDDHLFTGDTLFAEGCGICSMPGGDPEQMFASLQRLKALAAPQARVYPAHSYGLPPGQTMQVVQSHNIYLQFEKKEHFIDFRMRKKQSRTEFR